MAVHQGAQVAGQPREGVYQLGQVPAADIRVRAHSILRDSKQAAHALHAARAHRHQSYDQVSIIWAMI